jgi:hypothetical protein
MHYALCELGIECLNVIQMKFVIQRLKIVVILRQNSFNGAAYAQEILIVWHLGKIEPEVLSPVISVTPSDSATLSSVMWTLWCCYIVAPKDPKMSKQVTGSRKKELTLMSPQKFEIIRRFESGESRSVVVALYNLGS